MNTKNRSLGMALVLALMATGTVVGLTGCAGDRYTRSTGEYIDDQTLRGRVDDALDADPVFKYDAVKITAFKGTIQLAGFVFTDDQRNRAGEVARRVYGVNEVVNNIIVRENDRRAWDDRPVTSPDRRKIDERREVNNSRSAGEYVDDKTLTARVKSALNHSEVKLDGVDVNTYNGTVQLSGFVNTGEQKSRAGDITKQVAGVRDVANNITVKDKL